MNSNRKSSRKTSERRLIQQLLATRTNAWPTREVVEAVAVTVLWFRVIVVLRREGIECAVVGCVVDGGHVFADGVPVDVMRTGTRHQLVGHVVDGDCVLMLFGVLVALVGDFNESRGINVEGKLFGLCAFLCRLIIL
ncbi:hypothetical protein [Haladaptatus sp. T7]|uniref:hypothetical protein n=1 Tax=Haladaptatus sp. T7 TaxID=2029368 RepID=UPI002231860C|nr:hypothetical protein [Haladaptatus sp. T7]